jgi:hypothetical protein
MEGMQIGMPIYRGTPRTQTVFGRQAHCADALATMRMHSRVIIAPSLCHGPSFIERQEPALVPTPIADPEGSASENKQKMLCPVGVLSRAFKGNVFSARAVIAPTQRRSANQSLADRSGVPPVVGGRPEKSTSITADRPSLGIAVGSGRSDGGHGVQKQVYACS